MNARALRCALMRREIGAEELARFYLARIDRYGGRDALNAVSQVDESALAAARELDARAPSPDLPLYGLPLLIKDNIDVRGLRTTAGSPALCEHIARADAPVVAALRAKGAVILGKTNMTEFANFTTRGMPAGFSALGGQVKNAYDASASPSGSSSGSAVAVSARLCAGAIGTDTSFSVVGCATVNGVAGLKPPAGALPQAGIVPIAHTLDSAGALAYDFGDALLLCEGMRAGAMREIAPVEPRTLRVAINTYNREQVSAEQTARYEALFNALSAAGARLTEIVQPPSPLQMDLMRYEFQQDLDQYLRLSGAPRLNLSEIVDFYKADPARMPYGISLLEDALAETDGAPDGAGYQNALRERLRLREQTLMKLRAFDVCVMTGPTNIMHFTGLPSAALPLDMAADGTPRGVILYGANEEKLCAAALAIEALCPGVRAPRL